METDLFVDGGDTISSSKNGLCDFFLFTKNKMDLIHTTTTFWPRNSTRPRCIHKSLKSMGHRCLKSYDSRHKIVDPELVGHIGTVVVPDTLLGVLLKLVRHAILEDRFVQTILVETQWRHSGDIFKSQIAMF